MVNIEIPVEIRILFDVVLDHNLLEKKLRNYETYCIFQKRWHQFLPINNYDPEIAMYLQLYIKEFYDDKKEWSKKKSKLEIFYKKNPDIKTELLEILKV